MKHRVVVIDDHPILRAGIKNLIEESGLFMVVGEASDGISAIELLHEHKPKLAILDISMPKKNGLEVLQECQGLDIGFIILSNYEDDDYIIEAIKLGAKSYLLKDIETSNIIEALGAVARGETFYNNHVANILINQIKSSEDSVELTNKEKEVLQLISQGKSSKMIADELFVSNRTVETHRYRIMKKLNAQNSAQLIAIANQKKLI